MANKFIWTDSCFSSLLILCSPTFRKRQYLKKMSQFERDQERPWSSSNNYGVNPQRLGKLSIFLSCCLLHWWPKDLGPNKSHRRASVGRGEKSALRTWAKCKKPSYLLERPCAEGRGPGITPGSLGAWEHSPVSGGAKSPCHPHQGPRNMSKSGLETLVPWPPPWL